METPFYKHPRISGKLNRKAKENVAEEKPLSPLDDRVFKAMPTTNSDESREALRSLLSACTRREVSNVRIVNNDLIPTYLSAKTSRLDVHVTFNDGEVADLEMQVSKTGDDLRVRAEIYTADLLSAQPRKGKRYNETPRVYQIFFLNCVLYPNSTKLPRHYGYREEDEYDLLSDISEIILYELPKLEQRVRDVLEGKVKLETLSGEEKWCIYMKYRHEKLAAELIRELCREEKGIMFAEKTITKVSRSYQKAAREMAIRKNEWDQFFAIRRALREEKLDIARKMKTAGRPAGEIAEFTGLSAEVIADL
jgi:predicted transposase/invertase (TIGR01784 family)